MSIQKVVGIEQEYAISILQDFNFNPTYASFLVVNSYDKSAEVVWDYEKESPLEDARGFRREGEDIRFTRKENYRINNILENGGRIEIRRNEAPSVKDKTIDFNYAGVEHTIQFGDEEASIRGGNFSKDMYVEYVQEGDRIRLEIWDEDDHVMNLEGFYDGKRIESVKEIFVDIYDGDIYGEISYIIKSDF